MVRERGAENIEKKKKTYRWKTLEHKEIQKTINIFGFTF